MFMLLLFLIPYLGKFGTFLLGLVLGLGYLSYKIIKKQQYWKRKNVKYVKPMFLFGNFDMMLNRKAFATQISDLYNNYPEERYFGVYQFTQPMLVVRDPALVKQITVKEFDHFVNHRGFVDPEADPYFGRNLAASRDERWRELRATLSPSFTSSKMRVMFGLIEEISQQFVQHLKNQKQPVVEVEMKDILTRYTNDVIATTAFGLKCNSLENADNEFYQNGRELTNFSGLRLVKFFIASASLRLSKLLGLTFIPTHIAKYFERIILETVRVREEKNIVRPDMIHLLMEAKKHGNHVQESDKSVNEGFATVEESKLKTKKIEITDDDIVSQAIIFFLAGFDTVSTQTQFIFYELAKNPQVQEHLRREIDSVEPTYENILGLKYLDMVVSETMRKWPAAFMTDRQVSKKFTIEPEKPSETALELEEGNVVWFIIFGMHRDPKYYPDPEKFDPERFSEENKHKINPAMYLPFGAGPRNCIGSRFALLEMKLLTYYVLKHFEIVETDKTSDKIVFDKKKANIMIEGGIWLGFKERNAKNKNL